MAKYKKRKDGRYEAKVNVGKSPEGKYNRVPVYGHTILELEENIRKTKNQADQGVDLLAAKPSVQKWAEKWLAVYKASVGPSQRRVYNGMISKWLKPILSVRIDHVREVQLQEILSKAAATLAQSSVDKLYNCIRGIFGTARGNGLTSVDVSAKLDKPNKLKRSKRHALTALERSIFEYVCTKMLGADDEDEAIMTMIMMYAGLRIGEMTALFANDITEDYISVNKTIIFEKNGNAPAIKPSPKSTAGFRKVPILPPLLPFVRSLLAKQPDIASDQPVFRRGGRMYSKIMRRQYWARMMQAFSVAWAEHHSNEKGGLSAQAPPVRDITAHWLRHTFATMLYDADVDIKTAQKYMGDSTATVIMEIYMELSAEKETSSEVKLRNHFSPAQSDDNSDDTNSVDDKLTTQKSV